MIAEPSIAEKAKNIYETRLRSDLEASHRDEYVAIEPFSGQYFIGDTFLKAALDSKKAYPDRECFVIRIGHEAAFHIGAAST